MQFTLNFIYSCFMSLGSTVSYFCVDVNLFPTSFSCLVYSLSIWNLRLSRLRIKEYYIEYRVKVLEWSGLLLLHCALKVYGGISVIQSSECCHATIITEGLYYHNFIPVTLPNNSSRFLKRRIFSLCPNIFMGLPVHWIFISGYWENSLLRRRFRPTCPQCNPHWKRREFVNPLHPNISIHILHTLSHTFPLVLTRRIPLKIQAT